MKFRFDIRLVWASTCYNKYPSKILLLASNLNWFCYLQVALRLIFRDPRSNPESASFRSEKQDIWSGRIWIRIMNLQIRTDPDPVIYIYTSVLILSSNPLIMKPNNTLITPKPKLYRYDPIKHDLLSATKNLDSSNWHLYIFLFF